jgi:hypothetical protein
MKRRKKNRIAQEEQKAYKRIREPATSLRCPSGPSSESAPSSLSSLYFVELFAGEGTITQAMKDLGIECEPPNDIAHGGTDFESKAQVARLKSHLQVLRMSGKRLIVHLAPPCSTFSRARDRSDSTRLRSSSHPAGLAWLNPDRMRITGEANRIAWHAFDFAAWAAEVLDAVVSLENPTGSYIWPWSTLQKDLPNSTFEDAVVSQCLFGAPYRKNTTFRLWNAEGAGLQRQCTKSAEGHTCGSARHDILAFDGLPTGLTGSIVEAPTFGAERSSPCFSYSVQENKNLSAEGLGSNGNGPPRTSGGVSSCSLRLAGRFLDESRL